MFVLADNVFAFWLITSNFWYLFAFFEAIHSAITWLIISSKTTLRAVFMIPECSWEQRSSDMIGIGPVVWSLSLDIERVFSPVVLQVSTTDFRMKGLNLLSAWLICTLVKLAHNRTLSRSVQIFRNYIFIHAPMEVIKKFDMKNQNS